MKNKFKYKAYISYSHCDERWAVWLHRALESYRVPRNLVGIETPLGKVPSRIRPVFRDRDDLSSASDLGGTVKQALTDSENMIIVCSPDAAASFWVNEEIRQFAGLGRFKQIFCVIVDGEPGSVETASTCFPAALAEVGLTEPLAADVRKWADGRRLSRLKLVAGMLGLPLDQLRRRDLQKRQKAWALASIAAVVVTAVLITAIVAWIAAHQRRISGESLVVYKLNELRTMLNVTVDPENLSRLQTWRQADLDDLIKSAGSGEDALIRTALELRNQGNAFYEKLDLDAALEKYQQSWVLIAENYRRDRANQANFFELGQAEFYIGQIFLEKGELDRAEEAFMSYAEITRRLIVLQPENAEWVLEMSYALSNLGFLQEKRGASNPERSLQLMQSALEYNQIALVLDPQNQNYQSELGQSHAFFADAQLGVCDLEGALLSRQKNVLLETDMLAQDATDTRKMQRLAWALNGLANVQEQMGSVDDTIESLESALQYIEPFLTRNPEDRKTIRFVLARNHQLIMLKSVSGDLESAFSDMEALDADWQLYFQGGASDDFDSKEAYASYRLDRAWLARANGNLEISERLLDDVMADITGSSLDFVKNREAANLLMRAAFQYWEMKQEMVPETILLQLPYYWSNSQGSWSCVDASMAARKAIMLGDMSRAGELTAYLMDRGYGEVSFMRVCKSHSLCQGR